LYCNNIIRHSEERSEDYVCRRKVAFCLIVLLFVVRDYHAMMPANKIYLSWLTMTIKEAERTGVRRNPALKRECYKKQKPGS